MLACLTALFVTPYQANITIHTDSAATIKGFDKLIDFRHLSIRKREKIPNFQIWFTIAYLIDTKQMLLNFVKVKAHSGDHLNDRADHLAKAAVTVAPRLNIKYLSLPSIKVKINCDYLTLEASSRQSIKTLHEAKHFYHLLQLQRNSDLKLLTEHQHINWNSTSFMLNYNTSDKERGSTSFNQHRQRFFKYKLFSEELPTLTKMRLRRPDLYSSDVCQSCHRSIEI